jgi:hypothetical protein
VAHEVVAAVEAAHDESEEAAGDVEPESQLPGGAVVIEVADEVGVHGVHFLTAYVAGV